MRQPPPELQPMSTFDPSQPAILHDMLNDKIIPWSGQDAAQFQQYAKYEADGTVEWDGLVLDGWGNVLGG
jgi:hypothetical protein